MKCHLIIFLIGWFIQHVVYLQLRGTPDDIAERDSPRRNTRNRDMCCPRRPSSGRNAPARFPCPCPPEPISYEKYIKVARIILIVVLLCGFIWYNSDRTYHVLRRELDKLSCHINGMEDFLKTTSNKKGDVEKQLMEIADTLPQIKDMARSLRDDVDKCKPCKGSGSDCLRAVIREELENFSADKTGRTDYALESSGGLILNTRNTKSFASTGSLSLFGIPLCQSSNSPRALIQPGVMPGECWAFKGAAGAAVIKLVKPIIVTGVSVEHIPRRISPTGNTNTAPKEFSIWGLHCSEDIDGFFFGKFKYDISGTSVQYFPVMHRSLSTFDIVEFKVHSNHGHPEYTCVYRLRVHGDIKK